MNDRSPKALNRRRILKIGTLGAATLAAFGFTRVNRHTALGGSDTAGVLMDFTPTVLAFVGALFGKELAAGDAADLSDRLKYNFAKDDSFKRDCVFLARYVERQARERGAGALAACTDAQKDAIVDSLMHIDPQSVIARLLSRSVPSEREHYRMRASTIGRLSWIYRHSSAAWRARGYRRWPGVPGDWHEVLEPGAAYP